MAEITGHEPIEDAAVLLQTDMGERFKIDGFRGLRRVEIKRFASRFFIREDNPNGTIEPFNGDMPKDQMVPMMDLYLSQGKFGADPFNLRPQDKMADLQRQIEELKAAWQGPQANPATETFNVEKIVPMPDLVPRVPTVVVPLEDWPYRDIVSKAKGMGINPWKKTRTVLISEIEAKEAE